MTNPQRIPNAQDISNSMGCSRNAATSQLRSAVHASPPVIEPRDVYRQEVRSRYCRPVISPRPNFAVRCVRYAPRTSESSCGDAPVAHGGR